MARRAGTNMETTAMAAKRSVVPANAQGSRALTPKRRSAAESRMAAPAPRGKPNSQTDGDEFHALAKKMGQKVAVAARQESCECQSRGRVDSQRRKPSTFNLLSDLQFAFHFSRLPMLARRWPSGMRSSQSPG